MMFFTMTEQTSPPSFGLFLLDEFFYNLRDLHILTIKDAPTKGKGGINGSLIVECM